MNPGASVEFVANIWEEIISISTLFRFERNVDKGTEIIYVPTLDNIRFYFDMLPPVYDKRQLAYYIRIFHSAYIQTLLS